MFGTGPTDVDTYERNVTAQLDRDLMMLTAQGEQFQQMFNAMMASWQPMPPMMFAQRADGLAQWIEYFRQAALPATDWLARAGRPAAGQRLAAILEDLGRAVINYRQMASQQAEHLGALHQAATATCYGQMPGPQATAPASAQTTGQPAAPTPSIHEIQVGTYSEINAGWAEGQKKQAAAFDRYNALFRSTL